METLYRRWSTRTPAFIAMSFLPETAPVNRSLSSMLFSANCTGSPFAAGRREPKGSSVFTYCMSRS